MILELESERKEEERRGAEVVVNCRLARAVAAEGARRRRGRRRGRLGGRGRRRLLAVAPTDVFAARVHGLAPEIPVPHRSVQGSRTAAVPSLPSLTE